MITYTDAWDQYLNLINWRKCPPECACHFDEALDREYPDLADEHARVIRPDFPAEVARSWFQQGVK